MFEDSTFASNGRIRTRSRDWMIATLALNSSILLALVLIPLICPQALPREAMPFLIDTPQTPAPLQQIAQPVRVMPLKLANPFLAPRRIPSTTYVPSKPETSIDTAAWDPNAAVPSSSVLFPGAQRIFVEHPTAKDSVRVAGTIEDGLLLRKTMPVYPQLAVAMHAEGTVVLAATISRSGMIENLRALSGPPVLRQAALEAVRSWRYRPYLLDGQPVEVETSINVVFSLN